MSAIGTAASSHLARLALRAQLIIILLCAQAGVATAIEISRLNSDQYSGPTIKLQDGVGDLIKVNKVLRIDGEIESGDAQRLQKFIEDIDDLGWPGVLSLNSKGGDFREGIKIAKLIRERNLVTLVERDSVCLSACAVAFMAGFIAPEEAVGPGARLPARFLQAGGRLGFHRPRMVDITSFDPSVFEGLKQAEIDEIMTEEYGTFYDLANQLIQEMLAVDIGAWNTDLLLKMLLATRRNGEDTFVEVKTVREANIWDIAVIGVKVPLLKSRDDFIREVWNICDSAFLKSDPELWKDQDRAPFQADIGGERPNEDGTISHRIELAGEPQVYNCDARHDQTGEIVTVQNFNNFVRVHVGGLMKGRGVANLYHPNTQLTEIVEQSGSHAQSPKSRLSARLSRCKVLRGETVVDNEPCSWQINDGIENRDSPFHTFTWPSGNNTVLSWNERGQLTAINDKPATQLYDNSAARICAKSETTGNTFCHYLK